MDSDYGAESEVTQQVAVVADVLLYIMLFGVVAAVFHKEQADPVPIPYKTKEERRRCRRSWFHVPSMRMIYLWQWFSDIFQATATVYYLYNWRTPVTTQERDYYVSMFSLFFSLCCTKAIWFYLTFNHFRYGLGMAGGTAFAILDWVISVTLVVLLFVRASYLAACFMVPVAIYYTLTLCWNSHIAKTHFPVYAGCCTGRDDEEYY